MQFFANQNTDLRQLINDAFKHEKTDLQCLSQDQYLMGG